MDDNSNQKILGILGGMGPYATVHFFKRILDITPILKDRDHFRILIDNQVKIASRTRAILFKEDSPVSEMIMSINNLENIGANVILVPCNSAHYFYDEVSRGINVPWINMLECVANKVLRSKCTFPLILGGYVTTNKRIYSKYIADAQYLNDEDNVRIEKIIEEIKLSNSISNESKSLFKSLIKDNINRIDSVIFACSELPITFDIDTLFGIPVFDSAEIYAEESKNYGYFNLES